MTPAAFPRQILRPKGSEDPHGPWTVPSDVPESGIEGDDPTLDSVASAWELGSHRIGSMAGTRPCPIRGYPETGQRLFGRQKGLARWLEAALTVG